MEDKKETWIILEKKTERKMEFWRCQEGDDISEFVNKAIEKYCEWLYKRYINDVYTSENITDD